LRVDASDWARLGNELYLRGDLEGAVHSYGTALRRRAEGGVGVAKGHGADPWLLGNLARAYIGLEQYSRAEDLLRDLVLEPGKETEGLDLHWLRQRPSDLSELGQLENHAAALSAADGHLHQAIETLDEVRPWLEAGLRKGLFANERARDGACLAETRAYALNALGHNHRLRHELAFRLYDLLAAREHLGRATETLEASLALDPYLGDGWDALLALHRQNLFVDEAAPGLAAKVVERLEALAGDARGRRVRDWVRKRQPEAWKGAEVERKGKRRGGKRTKADDTRTTAA
jgi:tetratricopeptide (TPR) repeat protein